MSATVTKPDQTKAVVDAVVAAVKPDIDKLSKDVAEIREKAAQVQTPARPDIPFAVYGPLGKDSQPYSFARMAAVSMGVLDPENAKYELEVSQRLKEMYKSHKFHRTGPNSWLAPFATGDVVHYAAQGSDADARWAGEMQMRVKGWRAADVDPDEGDWHADRGNVRHKSLNTLADTQGGVLRGFPTLGELIELQRNIEVFPRAGATEVSLPPNGMLTLPKQVNSTTAYYANEGLPVSTGSDVKYGQLELQAKKLFVRTELTNDLLRFVTPSVEAMVRADMTEVAKRRFDRAQLSGGSGAAEAPNGVGVRGLITYTRTIATGTPLTQWVQGQDYVLEYTAGTVGAAGNTLKPEDVFKMISVLPDETQDADNLTWVGRFDLYAALANRRADAVTAADGAGMFLFNLTRELGSKQARAINGYRYVGSSQVSNQRVKGAGTALTYLLVGEFRQWVIGRFGVMEFLATNVSDNAFDNDTTRLRAIQYHDAGPRHASAFALCDQLVVA